MGLGGDIEGLMFRGGPCGTERERSFSGVTQQVSGKPGTRMQASQLVAYYLLPTLPCLYCTHLMIYGCQIMTFAG